MTRMLTEEEGKVLQEAVGKLIKTCVDTFDIASLIDKQTGEEVCSLITKDREVFVNINGSIMAFLECYGYETENLKDDENGKK